MKNIVVIASGNGSNLQAIIDGTRNSRINGKVVLVISNNENAFALKRAGKEGINGVFVNPEKFKTEAEYNKHLYSLCAEKKADLICLAGYMRKLPASFISKFENRIMNVHPALLPLFGGKGFYGDNVHRAVINSGVKYSGATVHFVNKDYDAGPVILQQTVPVFGEDTAETLAQRVHSAEHFIYPKAVSLFCEDRLKIENGKVSILAQKHEQGKVKRVLISVSDKTGIADFAKKLSALGIEIISTSATAKIIKDGGVPVTPIENITGFPQMLDGRVKTLHPSVHAGILFRRDDTQHQREMDLFALSGIDMVVVNLYPFEKTAANTGSSADEIIENIDIGGVALIRAGAKNFENVAVVTDAAHYKEVLEELEDENCILSDETRRKLAVCAFAHTAKYDTAIYDFFAKQGEIKERHNVSLDIKLHKTHTLRYGENPHQSAALYSLKRELSFKELQGKPLSYNNLLDAHFAWECVLEFEKPAVVIVKHATPCGIAENGDLPVALKNAWGADGLSAFGGIIAVNKTFTKQCAEFLKDKFVEVICAPDFEEDALELLSAKPNLRVIKRKIEPSKSDIIRSIGDEVLVMSPDDKTFGDVWKSVSKRPPTADEEAALKFAWRAVKHIRSNAIVLADTAQTVGVGAGQMSRVDSVFMAGHKYEKFVEENGKPAVLVLASDAFFPFRDAVEEAVKIGATAIVEPGGSVRDEEVINAADEHNIALIFTGIRHFKH